MTTATTLPPRISVLMGIYNCADTLAEALESLLAQTYTRFKVIMCDDGSTDATAAVARSYVERYPAKFILVSNDRNRGLNYTLNHCLSLADTEFCARMDGDDICHPTRFAKQIAFLDEHPELALVSCPMNLYDDNGIWGHTSCIQFPTPEQVLKHSPCFTHAAVLIRTAVYKEVGGYTIDDRLLRVEDCHLWFKIYAAGYRGGNLQERLYSMRDDRNATARRNWKARRNAIYVMFCGYRLFKKPWYTYPGLFAASALEIAKFLLPTKAYEYFHRKRQ